MIRKGSDKKVHDTMVRIRAESLKDQGYSVNADIEGFDKPDEIKGKIPDVFAVKGSSKIIIEAETCQSYSSEHTREQFLAFSGVYDSIFQVIVPKSCIDDAKAKAKEWGIKAVWWSYKE